MSTMAEFERELYTALESSILDLLKKIRGERLYAVSLFTNDEVDFANVGAAANTEEQLQVCRDSYAARDPGFLGHSGYKQLRWSFGDWGYFNFSPRILGLKLPPGEGPRRDNKIYKILLKSLLKIQQLEAFRHQNQRPVFLITCGDMSDEFLLRGMRLLNPPQTIEDYLQGFTAAPYLKQLDELPAATKVDTVISLYRDLSLGVSSELTAEATARNVTYFSLEPLIRNLGSDGVTRLLDLVERYGFGASFNPIDSPAFVKFGACTAESRMCTSAIFIIAQCRHVEELHFKHMQKILLKRTDMDQALAKTSTLAENIARVLHTLRPKKFPKSELDPKTNHLRNPQSFL